MPNWCTTDVQIKGPEKEILHLRDLIKKWVSTESDIPNGFGKGWLGNIVRKAGFNWEKVNCRGVIYNFTGETYKITENENAFCFSTETAWVPMHEMWHMILDKYAPNCTYIYNAEEYGCEIWETNDFDGSVYGKEDINIDCMEIDKTLKKKLYLEEGTNYFTNQEFIKWAKKILHITDTKFTDISKKLTEYIEEYDEENNTESNVVIRRVEYVHPW